MSTTEKINGKYKSIRKFVKLKNGHAKHHDANGEKRAYLECTKYENEQSEKVKAIVNSESHIIRHPKRIKFT